MVCSGTCSSAESPPTACRCRCNGAGHGAGGGYGSRGGSSSAYGASQAYVTVQANPDGAAVRDALRDYIASVRPAESNLDAVRRHRRSIQQGLEGRIDIVDVRSIGSHARGTAIAGGSDADYLAVIRQDEATWGRDLKNSNTVLRRVQEALQERHPQTLITRDGPAVQVHFADGTVDVVPGVWAGTANGSGHPVFIIPDGDGGWMRTTPDLHAKHIREADERSGGKLKPAARGLKAFRERNDKPVPLKGLYIEMAMVESGAAGGVGKPYTRILRDTLAWMAANDCADIADRSGQGDPIRCAGTAAQREHVRVQVKRAAARADKAIEAEDRGDHEEARRQWSMIYNDDV